MYLEIAAGPISCEKQGPWCVEGQITNGLINVTNEISHHAVIISQVNFSTSYSGATPSRSITVTTPGCSNRKLLLVPKQILFNYVNLHWVPKWGRNQLYRPSPELIEKWKLEAESILCMTGFNYHDLGNKSNVTEGNFCSVNHFFCLTSFMVISSSISASFFISIRKAQVGSHVRFQIKLSCILYKEFQI